MKTIVTYFHDTEPLGYPFNYPDFLSAYKKLTVRCAENNIRFCIVRGQESYLGTMKFSHGWEFKGEDLIDIPQEITADLIYMKSRAEALKTGPNDNILSDPRLDDICRDKLTSYDYFKKFMKACVPVRAEDWQEQIAKLTTEKIVLKPVHGDSGEGIIFSTKSEFNFDILPKDGDTYLAQEFLDSSAGVAGIMTGRHDMRFVMANGEPVVAYIRAAKEGSMLSNTAQGATVVAIDLNQVPAECFEIAKTVDKQLTEFPFRMYGIDFMFEDGTKPYVTELNSRPGVPDASWIGEERQNHFLDALIGIFQKA
jgi:predicted ATP-grasp superfamily ATP-dependent carboligase